MSVTTYSGTVDGAEPPELMLRNLRVGSRLWAASIGFFFVSFLFAFFYLRALNSNGLWRGWAHVSKTHHTNGPSPSLAFGIVILICVLASAAVARAAVLLAPVVWRIAIGASILLALAALGLQAAQFSSLGFGPTDGGYASVFVGWTGLYTVFLLGTVYWLGTVLGDNVRRIDVVPGLHAASVEAVSFVLGVLALVELAAFILLYIVA